MAKTVILARHAESEASSLGVVNGNPSRPIGLTDRGREQARRLGEQLAGERADLCVVTEFPRTQQTADIALQGLDVPRLVMAELNDPPFGRFEGRPIDEFRAWLDRYGPTKPLGGESRVATVRRYARGLRKLIARPERTVVVIAHGLPITYTVLAVHGQDLPLALAAAQVSYAAPHRLGDMDVQHAAVALEQWAQEQERAA
jgi:2,3-bisphosphoglycerate-dependent phosphoglycerate mutase